MTLAQTIYDARISQRMTARELAKAASLSHGTIYSIENGYRPSEATIFAISDALDIDAMKLMRLADEIPSRTGDAK